jgi:uncharacterized membrane protein
MTSALSSLTELKGSREISGTPDEHTSVVTNARLWPIIRRVAASCLWGGAISIPLLAHPQSAHADFRLCNNTASRVGVAIGYKDGEGWATEGWWNVPGNGNCETLLRGELAARFYYIYAVDYDRGGEWSGQAFMCTRDKEFTIRGTENCLARGYDRTGFFEVDTGEQRSWTVQLTDTAEQASQRPSTNAPLIPTPPAGSRQAPATVAPFAPGSQSR